jgi:cytochrome c-type biogenesis protein
MIQLLTGLVFALWMGILTSISPCPLATNIVAVSFVARRVSSPWKVFLSGVLYAVGRTITYLVIGILLTAGLVSAPRASHILQKYMNRLLGPILIVVGMVLLELIGAGMFRSSGSASEKLQKRVERMGMFGALLLGLVFAASFCPISAGLFFGTVISTAAELRSVFLVPSVFGVGTALPVLVFAVMIACGVKSLGTAFNRIAAFELWARRITGVMFIVVGLYYGLTRSFGLFS